MNLSKLNTVITLLAALTLIAAHTQLTLRQLSLRVAGVREGNVHKVLSLESYVESTPRFDHSRLQVPGKVITNQLAVLKDDFATFIEGELKGDRVFFGSSSFEVLDNTATHILVKCDDISDVDAELNSSTRYTTGYSVNSGIARLAKSVPSINITVSDLLLAVLAVLIFLHYLKDKARPSFKSHLPLLAAVPYVLVGACSLIPAIRILDTSYMEPDLKKGVVELLQLLEVLVIGFWCSARLFEDEENRKRFPILLLAMTGIVVFAGLIEYIAVFAGWTLRGLLDVEAIDSIFGIRFNSPRAWSAGSESNRNILALYLAIVFPFALYGVKTSPKRWMQVVCICIAIGSLFLIMQAWLLIATLAVGGILVYSWHSFRGFAYYTATALIAFLSLFAINSHHSKVLADSIAYHRSTDTYGLQPMPLKGGSFEGQNAWQQKYLERQVAWNAIPFSPILGMGVGNYQTAINSFYENTKVEGHVLVKQPVNLMERNSHSLFYVGMVETGILGVIFLALFIAFPLVKLSKAVLNGRSSPLASTLIASSAIIFLTSFQMSFLVRGVQVVGIAILGCCYAVACLRNEGVSESD